MMSTFSALSFHLRGRYGISFAMEKPRIRYIEAFPYEKDGKQLVILRDAKEYPGKPSLFPGTQHLWFR